MPLQRRILEQQLASAAADLSKVPGLVGEGHTVIDFASYGLYYSLCLDARRSGYTVTVNPTPNPEYEGFTPEQIASANRAKYEAVVAAHKAAENDPTPF